MTTSITTISFRGAHGHISAHLAQPEGKGPRPGIVLLQEGLGVTAHLRAVAQRFAAQGYSVLVPDLYSHEAARATLSDEAVTAYIPLARSPDREAKLAALPAAQKGDAVRVLSWFDARNLATHLPDATSSVEWFARHSSVKADAIAAIGFSLGGGLVAQLAARGAPLKSGIIFYGAGPALDVVKQVTIPLEGHYAEKDPAITTHVPALVTAFKSAGGTFTAHVYPGTEHGFFNETRPVYHAASATLAWDRSLAFLTKVNQRAATSRSGS
jgi:carboxymethylenebutenolidase